MNQVMVIFSLAAAGCLVRLSTDLVLQVLARRAAAGTSAAGPYQGTSHASEPKADPVFALGLTLTIYGASAIAIVSELPGGLAFQRTWLAFALLCVGGLVGEISRTSNKPAPAVDVDADDVDPPERTPGSVGLSVALMLAMNLAIAVLASGQGLVQIVPPPAQAGAQSGELEQIVVVARRGSNDQPGPSTYL